MITTSKTGRRTWAMPLLAVWLTVGLAGCDSLLEVENPNNVSADDLANPISAPSVVSGAIATVIRGWGSALTCIATSSDELVFVGSRDSWQTLDNGDLSERTNEFTDAALPLVGEGRWMADTAVHLLEGFDAAGELSDRSLLARAYLNAAHIYMAIGDWFDDFPIASNGRAAAPPPGPDAMDVTYDTADAYLGRGLAVAQAIGDPDLEVAMLATRASVAHRRAIWNLLNPPGSTPANPLVGVPAQAVSDAQAVLNAVGGSDWVFYHVYSATTVGNNLDWVNERADLRIDVKYGVPAASNTTIDDIALTDPIDGVKDPVLSAIIGEVAGTPPFPSGVAPQRDLGPLRVVSEREMYLILAENEAAAGNTGAAVGFINQYRALDGLTPYDPGNPAHPTLSEMIEYHRSASLFMQGRRMADMYRFGIIDPEWQSGSEAVMRPGTFLPITQIECNSNPGEWCN